VIFYILTALISRIRASLIPRTADCHFLLKLLLLAPCFLKVKILKEILFDRLKFLIYNLLMLIEREILKDN